MMPQFSTMQAVQKIQIPSSRQLIEAMMICNLHKRVIVLGLAIPIKTQIVRKACRRKQMSRNSVMPTCHTLFILHLQLSSLPPKELVIPCLYLLLPKGGNLVYQWMLHSQLSAAKNCKRKGEILTWFI